jgi:hypothetical protein
MPKESLQDCLNEKELEIVSEIVEEKAEEKAGEKAEEKAEKGLLEELGTKY